MLFLLQNDTTKVRVFRSNYVVSLRKKSVIRLIFTANYFLQLYDSGMMEQSLCETLLLRSELTDQSL